MLSVVLILVGAGLMVSGLLSVQKRFVVVLVTVAAGLLITGIGLKSALGGARSDGDRPMILAYRDTCYRFKVMGVLNMRCFEGAEEARRAMLDSPYYRRWIAKYGGKSAASGKEGKEDTGEDGDAGRRVAPVSGGAMGNQQQVESRP